MFLELDSKALVLLSQAAIHSFTLSLRHQLRSSGIRVVEMAPPIVDTGLVGSTRSGGTANRMMVSPDEFATEALRIRSGQGRGACRYFGRYAPDGRSFVRADEQSLLSHYGIAVAVAAIRWLPCVPQGFVSYVPGVGHRLDGRPRKVNVFYKINTLWLIPLLQGGQIMDWSGGRIL
ncbi:hypothetical protein [Mesorhizobium sp. M7A.F.Ca.US.011.01.1.1]|uniref:hypothetical protein n=1 Tax=Mesorhizobium sp. M7A.F.Ca.US.011.01.1.1 TaxID=2496741 RepID=UPI001FE1E57A|nr:hypothetical protein [Mesorhizobium sp. M7A.F.Ca.US.011.01.1.1]